MKNGVTMLNIQLNIHQHVQLALRQSHFPCFFSFRVWPLLGRYVEKEPLFLRINGFNEGLDNFF